MKVMQMGRRYDGQILTCGYGNLWPLSLHTTGFVKIKIKTVPNGRVKMSYVWAETREELLTA
jgi:hypothetical protein